MSAPPRHHQRENFQVPEGNNCTYSGASLPEVGRNAVILPPLGDHGRLSSAAVLGSEGGRHGQHNRTKQAKKHGSASPVASQDRTCGAEEREGTLLLGANADTAVGRNNSRSYHAAATITTTDIGRSDDPTKATEGHSIATAKDNREFECCARSDDEQCLGDAGHRKSVAADAENSDPVVETEEKEIDDSKAGGTSGDTVVVEASGGTTVDPEVGERAGTPSRGRTGRGRDPVSPVAAIRARVGLGLRNALAFGSEAQVSPSSASPQRSGTGWKRTPDRLKQAGAKGMSPLSWNRLKPGRIKQDAPGKVAPAAFFGDTPNDDLGDRDGCSKKNPCHNDNNGVGGDCKVATGEEDLTAEEEVAGDRHQEATAVSSNRLETAVRQPPTTAAAAGPSLAAKHARRVLARDNTLTSRDEWPELLDSEPDPELWALDKGEDDVLAAAKTMGSVLVRVVTWNLHAKPTPAADKLRETILPPGKVSGFLRSRQGFLSVGRRRLYGRARGVRTKHHLQPFFARHEPTFVPCSPACILWWTQTH